MNRRSMMVTLAAAVLAVPACADDPAAPAPTTAVVSMVPSGGATSVDPAAPIVITFSHAMRAGMEQYVALHQGGLDGPAVPMTCTWSPDATTLTCAPNEALASGTTYALHLGGGMRDAIGGELDYDQCLRDHDGQWATGAMLGRGGLGGGMMGGSGMMGPGWRHGNGTYGMVFTFTTA
jgi:hypothetical protein